MNGKRLWLGALLGALTALTAAALFYLGERLAGWTFVPFALFDWLARVLPGALVTSGIDAMVSTIQGLSLGSTADLAKMAEGGLALLLFMGLGAAFGVLLALIDRDREQSLVVYGAFGGLLLLLASLLLLSGLPSMDLSAGNIVWLALVFVGWGALLGRLVRLTSPAGWQMTTGGLTRRQFLYVVGAGSVTVLVTALGWTLVQDEESLPATGNPAAGEPGADILPRASNTSGPAESPPLEALQERIPPAPGTRPELTANENFYRIDINSRPPVVEAESWQLELSGLVEQPLTLTLDDLQTLPAQNQAITLSCISNQVGGDLISTSVWTGVRLKDVLERAGLQSGAQEVYMEAVDGFYESMPLEEAMDERTLLVYAMNGEPLPVEHGFPLRVFIPNHYGMKQPKWITRMEVIDHQGPGYWVDRGWSATAIPKTTSVIDTVSEGMRDPQTGNIPVGGIAYGGARGISRVEVQVDDGSWQEAELRRPPLSPLTWVQWRYDWPAEEGTHVLRVRAYDGDGDLQPLQDSPPHPDGATGVDQTRAVVA